MQDLQGVDDWSRRLTDLGYGHWHGEPGRRSFERRDLQQRATHHPHVVARDTPNWTEPVRFRDRLRTHPEDRLAYEALKRELVRLHDDTRTYSAAKSAFISRINALAARA